MNTQSEVLTIDEQRELIEYASRILILRASEISLLVDEYRDKVIGPLELLNKVSDIIERA